MNRLAHDEEARTVEVVLSVIHEMGHSGFRDWLVYHLQLADSTDYASDPKQ